MAHNKDHLLISKCKFGDLEKYVEWFVYKRKFVVFLKDKS